MLKFLIISVLLIYVVARFAGFFFRLTRWLTGKPLADELRRQPPPQPRRPEGTLTVIVPDEVARKQQQRINNNPDDYVDFEEVK